MPKRHIIPDECMDTFGVYRLKLLFNPEDNRYKMEYRNEDKSQEGMFPIKTAQAIELFNPSGKPIYILAYVDVEGRLQVFPDIGVEEQNW